MQNLFSRLSKRAKSQGPRQSAGQQPSNNATGTRPSTPDSVSSAHTVTIPETPKPFISQRRAVVSETSLGIQSTPESAPVATSVNISGETSKPSKVRRALDGAGLIFRFTGAVAGAVGVLAPLKAACEAVGIVLDTAKGVLQNKDDKDELQKKLSRHLAILESQKANLEEDQKLVSDVPADPRLIDPLEAYIRNLEELYQELDQINMNMTHQIIDVNINKERIADKIRKMDDALKIYTTLLHQFVADTVQKTLGELKQFHEEFRDESERMQMNRLKTVTPYGDQHRGCLEGTRKKTLKAIHDWIKDENAQKIFYLFDVAGSGKSTISKQIVEELRVERLLVARFFFSRDTEETMSVHLFCLTVSDAFASMVSLLKVQTITLKEPAGNLIMLANELKEQVDGLQDKHQANELKDQADEFKKQVNAFKVQVEKFKMQAHEFKDQADTFMKPLDTFQEQADELIKQANDFKWEMNKFQQPDRRFKTQASKLKEQAIELKKLVDKLDEPIDTFKKKIDGFKDRPDFKQLSLEEQFKGLVADPLKELNWQAILVVDALDECNNDAGNRTRLLDLLHSQQPSIPLLRIFMTGRPEPDIKSKAEKAFGYTNFDKLEGTNEDVERYIHVTLQDLLPEDKRLIVVQGAGGLFIWARLACDLLLAAVDPDSLVEELSGEVSLDYLYKVAIRVAMPRDKPSQRTLLTILAIIMAAKRPLSVEELEMLLPELSERPRVVERVVGRLSSLLIYNGRTDPIRLLHITFRDFVTNRSKAGAYFVHVQLGHYKLASRCITIIGDPAQQNDLKQGKLPLLAIKIFRYSAESWATHYKMSYRKLGLSDLAIDFSQRSFHRFIDILPDGDLESPFRDVLLLRHTTVHPDILRALIQGSVEKIGMEITRIKGGTVRYYEFEIETLEKLELRGETGRDLYERMGRRSTLKLEELRKEFEQLQKEIDSKIYG